MTTTDPHTTTSSATSAAGPRAVPRQEWLVGRRELLAQEKLASRARDELSAARRRLPMVKLDQVYVFDGPNGPSALGDLFAGRRQLIVYHFMFDPGWEEGCPSCSFFADNIGHLAHLHARDTSFAVISRAPVGKIKEFKARMGWSFPWFSAGDGDFTRDFHVNLDEARGSDEYNYEPAADLLARGEIWKMGDLPGLSVFLRDGTDIFHTYSTYSRGLDVLMGTYQYLDLTPLGRGADDLDPYLQAWVRHHDNYPTN